MELTWSSFSSSVFFAIFEDEDEDEQGRLWILDSSRFKL